MRIVVEASLAACRLGVTASATRLKLVGHGVDTVSATSRLEAAISASEDCSLRKQDFPEVTREITGGLPQATFDLLRHQ